MIQSIPASQLVSVLPSVLAPAGAPLALNAVFLTTDPSIPTGTAQAFTSAAAVSAWFGPNAQETLDANVYFSGFDGSDQLPGTLYFYQYNPAATAGYLRGGSGLTLAQVVALSAGTLTLLIDSVSHVSASIDLSAATSLTNAAALITTGLDGGTPTTTAVCSYDAQRGAFVITSSTTGAASAVAFPTTDALATGLLLTAVTGAVLSHGAALSTPAATMNGLVAAQQNWATFMNVTDPDAGSLPPTNKLAFANWTSTASPAGKERFAYIAWDSDLGPTTSNADASCFAALLTAAGYNGTSPVFDLTSGLKAAFICGCAGSIDFDETNGRITFAYKGQAGLAPDVTSATVAANLKANGYNFYGSYATATQQFQFLQPGSMPGSWVWLDPYINQIWLNNALQSAFLQLLKTVKALPYNTAGYTLLRSTANDPIQAALNAGVIVAGVALSSAQQAEINNAAGANVAQTIINQGYYLQILPASATARGARTSPPMTLWYTDGGSIQSISLASIDVE